MARDRYWLAGCLLLTAGLGVQSWRLDDVATRLEAAEARPYWPDRPEPVGLEQARAPRFSPSTRKSIPDGFWGEFAEDVHDCGGEQTLLVKATQLIWPGDDRQAVEKVEWTAPERLQVETRKETGIGANFGVILSEDREEITFVYTNTKNVVQRCSARAHGTPEVLRSADEVSSAFDDGTLASSGVSADDSIPTEADLPLTSN